MSKCIGILSAVLLFSVPWVSGARTVRETTYRYDQIWSTVVRFLRVDNGFAVLEQDKDTGYVLFEYLDGGRKLNGSMELIPQNYDGREAVAMGIRIQNMPTYVENVLMDKLVRKLRDEYGEPPVGKRIQVAPKQMPATDRKDSKPDADDSAANESAKDTIEPDDE